MDLLRLLMIVFDEKRHRSSPVKMIGGALARLASAVAGGGRGGGRGGGGGDIRTVCDVCMEVLTGARATSSAQQWLLGSLAVPLLRRTPTPDLVHIFTTTVAGTVAGTTGGGGNPLVKLLVSLLDPAMVARRPMAASCALQLLQLMYSRLNYESDIKGGVNSVYAGIPLPFTTRTAKGESS